MLSHLLVHGLVVFLCLLQELFETSGRHVLGDENDLREEKGSVSRTGMKPLHSTARNGDFNWHRKQPRTLARFSFTSAQYLWNFTMFKCSS